MSSIIHNLLEKTYEFAQLLIAVNEIEYSKQNKAQLSHNNRQNERDKR